MSWLIFRQTGFLPAYCRRHSRRKTGAPGPWMRDFSLQSHPPRLGALTCSRHTTGWHIKNKRVQKKNRQAHCFNIHHWLGQVEAMWMIHVHCTQCWGWLRLTGASDGTGNFVSWWKLTHQGSRNMVATLNPIRMHINMKTGRLLGTHAIITTAGMKSWERNKTSLTGIKRTESVEIKDVWFLTDSPMKTVALLPILRRMFCNRGTATEAATCGNITVVALKIQKVSTF